MREAAAAGTYYYYEVSFFCEVIVRRQESCSFGDRTVCLLTRTLLLKDKHEILSGDISSEMFNVHEDSYMACYSTVVWTQYPSAQFRQQRVT